MYLVEDDTFERARAIVSTLANELAEQETLRFGRPIDLRKVIRHAAGADLPAGGEAEYLSAIANKLEKTFSAGALFPHKRGSRDR
jgi:hypothetical protein